MKNTYVIYNQAGEILRVGNCPVDEIEAQAGADEFVLLGTACPLKDSVNPITQEIIPNGRPPVQPVTPPPAPAGSLPVATQLDLLWQAMDAGTFPKAEPFYSAIKASKEAQA